MLLHHARDEPAVELRTTRLAAHEQVGTLARERHLVVLVVEVGTEVPGPPADERRDAGALAFLVKPFQKSDLIPAIEVAMGRFRELRSLTGEIDALGEQLESRKVIDRAKGLLMDELSLSETDAFGFIQRTAMSERTRMRDVADRILDGSLRPGVD